jgi:hypothetical protein
MGARARIRETANQPARNLIRRRRERDWATRNTLKIHNADGCHIASMVRMPIDLQMLMLQLWPTNLY